MLVAQAMKEFAPNVPFVLGSSSFVYSLPLKKPSQSNRENTEFVDDVPGLGVAALQTVQCRCFAGTDSIYRVFGTGWSAPYLLFNIRFVCNFLFISSTGGFVKSHAEDFNVDHGHLSDRH